jgi:hypothetical protein
LPALTNISQRIIEFQASPCHTTELIWVKTGFVAQIVLRPDYPSPQTDLAHGYGTRYAKSCEAIQDRGTDLDLRNLPIEVAGREALTE